MIIGSTQLTLDSTTHPAIDAATNRFQTGQGYVFDKNGNLTTDAEGRTFVFNGDNKQKEVRDASNAVVGQYFYDGEGRRVKKVTDQDTTVFVYSAGKLIAEYSTAPPPQEPTTKWTVTDQLGSPRVLVDSLGQVVARRDFTPFGEEIFPDGTHRKTADKYTFGDDVRQKFTGYQKDEETQLDFAEARMYQNQHARFTAVDPLLASGKSGIPQTFNRYVYVVNNPLIYVDPDGLQVASTTGRVYQRGEFEFTIYRDEDTIEDGYRPFNGDLTYSGNDGYRYHVTADGWTNLGLSTEGMIQQSLTNRLIGNRLSFDANGFQNLPPDIIDRMQRELGGIGPAFVDSASRLGWRAIPDSFALSVSLPIFSGGIEISKNGNVFLGGNVTYGSTIAEYLGDVKSANRAIYPKLSIGPSVRYFGQDLSRDQRDRSISGADYEKQVHFITLVQPLVGDGPRSIRFGRPGYGVGGTYTSEKVIDGSGAIRRIKQSIYFSPEQK